MLDVRLGRWFSPDPITHPWQSPYCSMDNNPVALVDPLGLSTNGPPDGAGTSYQSDDGMGCWGGGSSTAGEAAPPAIPPMASPTGCLINPLNFAGQDNKIPVAKPSVLQSKTFSINKSDITEIFTDSPDRIATDFTNLLNQYMNEFGITNQDILAHFLSQVGEETGGLTKYSVTEDLHYTVKNITDNFAKYFMPNTNLDPKDYAKNPKKLANVVYGGRMGNGDEASGEGFLYRGGGVIQLTGCDNYMNFTNFYNKKYNSNCNFTVEPQQIRDNIELSVLSALWYFKKYVIDVKKDYCKWTVNWVSIKTNGPKPNGLPGRKEWYKKALKQFNKNEKTYKL